MFEGKETTREEAIRWVDENANVIRRHVRKYLPFAPYDQDDYLQDAYEAALAAVQEAKKRKIPFIPCFWILFRRKVTEVTPHPESKHRGGSSSPPMSACYSERYWQFGEEDDGDDLSAHIDFDRLYLAIREHLTEAERKILSRAIGVYGGQEGIKEIARNLGCSPANVRQALNRIYNRLSRLVANNALEIRRSDVETRRLTVITSRESRSAPDRNNQRMNRRKDKISYGCKIA